MNVIEQMNSEAVEKLVAERPVPVFGPGDTVRVHVKVVEGTRERIQVFEGVCIARKNRNLNSSFSVRKISHGEGVERVFPLHSPRIAKIEVMKRGKVRRAKLYYLRGRRGKAARIKERRDERGVRKKGERRVRKGAKASADEGSADKGSADKGSADKGSVS